MKKTGSAVLLFILLFSACVPTFSQRTISPRAPVVETPKTVANKDDFVQFQRISAISDGQGVLIQWEMKAETSNVGFYVYRVTGKGQELVNQIMVLGSIARSRLQTLSGEKYELYDSQGDLGSTYVIQSLAADGRKVSTDPISTKFSSAIVSNAGGTKQVLENRAAAVNGEVVKPALALPQPLQDAIQTQNLASDLQMQRWVAAQPGAKIAVKKEGLYRVTRAELAAAGFNLGISSANWRLFMQGIEQAIIVGPGDQYIEFYGKGIDTPESDTRVYYLIADSVAGKRVGTRGIRPLAGYVSTNYPAAPVQKERTSFVNTIQNGDAENFWGRVVFNMATTVPVNLTGVDYSSADTVITLKMQGFVGYSHLVGVVLNGHDLGSFAGLALDSFSSDIHVPTSFLVEGNNSLQLTSLNSGDFSLFDSVTVKYARKFQADQNISSFYLPGSRKVDLGGFTSPIVSTVTISETTPPTTAVDIPVASASASPGVLRMGSTTFGGGEGGNARITVSRVFGNMGTVSADLTLTSGTAVGGAACGPGIDFIIPNSPTITFPDGITSKFIDVPICSDGAAEAGETFTATLSNPTGGASLAQTNIRVFDITSDGVPQLITGLPIDQNGSSYTVKLRTDHSAVMYGIDESYLLQSPAVTINNPSTLSDQADLNPETMVIISNSAPDFMAAAQAWATYRRSPAGGGFTVKVVDVADIFDEYNYGTSSAASINSFLQDANSRWQTQYVLLIGDASYDPKNYLGFGAWDLVPTKNVSLIYEESGSDEALADFNNDGRAEIAIGRIPARSGADITTAFNKTTGFETPAMQSLSRGALFVYDVPNGYDFGSMSRGILAPLLPSSMPKVFVNRGIEPTPPYPDNLDVDPNSHPNLINALNANTSSYIVNYSGHGAAGLWGASAFFSNNDISQLSTANNHQSIFTMLTCFNGYFIRPDGDSLAETLLKVNNGGAVAAWASTTETTPDIQLAMATEFYTQLAAGNITRMGDLIKDAKASITAGSDVGYSWALMGDPALQVRSSSQRPADTPTVKGGGTVKKPIRPRARITKNFVQLPIEGVR